MSGLLLFSISAALAVMSGWTTYRLRLGGKVAGALFVCATPLLLALPLFLPGGDADGAGQTSLQAVALTLFGPAFLAALVGAGLGWLKTRQ